MFLNNYRRKFPSVNPLVNPSVIKKIYRRVCSASKSVGNIITDGICVLRRRKNSVGKTIKSCSVASLAYSSIYWEMPLVKVLPISQLFLFSPNKDSTRRNWGPTWSRASTQSEGELHHHYRMEPVLVLPK